MNGSDRQAWSPEEWEAADHVDNLRTRLKGIHPASPSSRVCPEHNDLIETSKDLLRANMWIIYHMPRNDGKNSNATVWKIGPFSLSTTSGKVALLLVPAAMVVLLVGIWAYVHLKDLGRPLADDLKALVPVSRVN